MYNHKSSFRIKKSIAKLHQNPVKYFTRYDFENMKEQLKQQGMLPPGFDPSQRYDVDGQPYYPPPYSGTVPEESQLVISTINHKITTQSWNKYKTWCQGMIQENPAFIYIRQSITYSNLNTDTVYLTFDNDVGSGYKNGIMSGATDDHIIDLIYNRNTDTFFIQYKRVNNQTNSYYVLNQDPMGHPNDWIPIDTLGNNELIEPPTNNLYILQNGTFTGTAELTNQIYD